MKHHLSLGQSSPPPPHCCRCTIATALLPCCPPPPACRHRAIAATLLLRCRRRAATDSCQEVVAVPVPPLRCCHRRLCSYCRCHHCRHCAIALPLPDAAIVLLPPPCCRTACPLLPPNCHAAHLHRAATAVAALPPRLPTAAIASLLPPPLLRYCRLCRCAANTATVATLTTLPTPHFC